MRLHHELILATTLAILGLGGAASPGRAQVVINEFAYDDSSTDDEEFVELFNAGAVEVDLTGWYLTTGDGASGPRYDLPETSIPPQGYLVLGSPLVPNVDAILGTTDLFGDGPSYLILWEFDDIVADAVAYEANKGLDGFPQEAIEEGGIWGNHVLVAGTYLSWQRWFDGLDTEVNALDFGNLPWTPGASNERSSLPAFWSDFEDAQPGQTVTELPGSFVAATIVDPSTVSIANPGAIAESPDGGQALIAWDPAGGGNFVVLEARPVEDLMFEAWVYFDAAPAPFDESETWSLGLRGTSGTFFNIPVLFEANGNTGVTWTYQVTSAGATLFLIDEGSGGLSFERVRLGEVVVSAGENDGWQRLRLEVEGGRVTGYFGGTYGSTDDGLRIDGETRTEGPGSFYMGYREALTDSASARPLTLDSLEVRTIEPTDSRFRRGDTNADGTVDLTDGVFVLNFLFLNGPAPTCQKSADADDGGTLDITDGVSILNYLFLGGPAPPPPSAECGPDPTEDPLSCEAHASC